MGPADHSHRYTSPSTNTSVYNVCTKQQQSSLAQTTWGRQTTHTATHLPPPTRPYTTCVPNNNSPHWHKQHGAGRPLTPLHISLHQHVRIQRVYQTTTVLIGTNNMGPADHSHRYTSPSTNTSVYNVCTKQQQSSLAQTTWGRQTTHTATHLPPPTRPYTTCVPNNNSPHWHKQHGAGRPLTPLHISLHQHVRIQRVYQTTTVLIGTNNMGPADHSHRYTSPSTNTSVYNVCTKQQQSSLAQTTWGRQTTHTATHLPPPTRPYTTCVPNNNSPHWHKQHGAGRPLTPLHISLHQHVRIQRVYQTTTVLIGTNNMGPADQSHRYTSPSTKT